MPGGARVFSRLPRRLHLHTAIVRIVVPAGLGAAGVPATTTCSLWGRYNRSPPLNGDEEEITEVTLNLEPKTHTIIQRMAAPSTRTAEEYVMQAAEQVPEADVEACVSDLLNRDLVQEGPRVPV
jgi:hypothetical protein